MDPFNIVGTDKARVLVCPPYLDPANASDERVYTYVKSQTKFVQPFIVLIDS